MLVRVIVKFLAGTAAVVFVASQAGGHMSPFGGELLLCAGIALVICLRVSQ